MKTINIIILLCLAGANLLRGQSFSETINRELTFEKKSSANVVWVDNINGQIKVEGYEGDKVVLEVTKTISAKTDARLETGKREIQLGVLDRSDTLIFFVEGGCNSFCKCPGSSRRHNEHHGWGYHGDGNGNDGHHCRYEYDFTMNFKLKVPAGVHLILRTVNEGDIVVENVKGSVEADNINGSIRLTNLIREVNASTINGDVTIDYAKNPDKASRFYTLNGDINANFQKGLGASLSFESFNGSFYTNLPKLESLPALVKQTDKEKGIQYKINGSRYKVGEGGVVLDFETFNGDVYLKEKN